MDTDIKSYLSIIYGENVTVIFDTYVFTWDTTEDGKKSGYIMAVNGAKLITEKVNDVVEIKDRQNNKTVGYVVFLQGQLDDLSVMCKISKHKRETVKGNVFVITDKLTFERAKIQSKYYSKDRPDMVLTFDFKRYTALFKENNELKCFASHS